MPLNIPVGLQLPEENLHPADRSLGPCRDRICPDHYLRTYPSRLGTGSRAVLDILFHTQPDDIDLLFKTNEYFDETIDGQACTFRIQCPDRRQ